MVSNLISFAIKSWVLNSAHEPFEIKRNYFYTLEREASANEAYNEIFVKMGALKDRYYSEVIDISNISSQIKIILDGVISEIKSNDLFNIVVLILSALLKKFPK